MDGVNTSTLSDLGFLRPNNDLQSNRKNNAEDLSVNDFMRLMLAQIQNQDPFEPMQNGDFIAQMAQFGTVSGIEQLQTSFSSFSESMFSNQALEAASLIGRHVQVATDTAALLDNPVTGAVELPENASALTIRIVDQRGVQVDSIVFDEQAAGTVDFMWNGTNSDGDPVEIGLYQITAEASIAGEATAINTYLDIPVTSVSFTNSSGGIELELLNGESMSFTKVREIK